MEEAVVNKTESGFNGLTEGNIGKKILWLSFPMILANSFDMVRNLIDAFFVGRISSESLAGVSIAGVIIFFLLTFAIGLGIGSMALLTRAFGEKNIARAERCIVQSIYVGTFTSVIIGISGFFLAPVMMKFLGADGLTLQSGIIFLKITFLGLITMFFMFQGAMIFQSAGDSVTPMKVGIITTVINLILCPLLIFGKLGFPRLEVAGAALSTVIAQTMGSIMMVYIFVRGKHSLGIKFDNWSVDREIIKKIFIIGVPSTLQMLLRSFSAVVLMKIVSIFGHIPVAVYGVGGRIFQFFLVPGFGFGAAAATLVGHNLGAKKVGRAEKSMLLATWYYLIFLLVSGVLFFIFARQVAFLFNPKDMEFVRIGTVYFRYLAVGAVFLSTGVVMSRAIQGAGDSVSPMVITGISLYLVQIPLAYVLSKLAGLNENGIWLAVLIGNIINALLMLYIFYKGSWKLKKH